MTLVLGVARELATVGKRVVAGAMMNGRASSKKLLCSIFTSQFPPSGKTNRSPTKCQPHIIT